MVTAEELGRRYRRDLAKPVGAGDGGAPPWLMMEFVEARRP